MSVNSVPAEKVAQTKRQRSTENSESGCVQPIGDSDAAQFPAAAMTDPRSIQTFHEQKVP